MQAGPPRKDSFDHFREHYPDWFPGLRERTRFVRQVANLWQVKAALQQCLTVVSGQADDPVQIIDTLPLPVCGYTRSGRDRCFKPNAGYGYCAAKWMKYYRFKIRKVLEHTVGVFLNLLLGRAALDLDGLLDI